MTITTLDGIEKVSFSLRTNAVVDAAASIDIAHLSDSMPRFGDLESLR